MLVDFREGLAELVDEDDAANWKRRYERLVSGGVECLGFGTIPLAVGNGWQEDPVHGHVWPMSYVTRVDFVASNARCDVKIVWERSRLQYALWIAEGVVYTDSATGRLALAQRYKKLVEQWTSANPPGYGPNWVSAMEIGIRALNLALAASLLWDDLADADRQTVRIAIFWHELFLRFWPERSDLSGNHYLVNLLGLLIIASVFGDDRTFQRRLRVFAAEANRQFEPSGIHVERTTAYHGLCTRAVGLAIAAGLRRTGRVDPMLGDVYQRACESLAVVASPGGCLPLIGDSDSGAIIGFGDDPRYFGSELGVQPLSSESSVDAMLHKFLRAFAGRPLPSAKRFVSRHPDSPFVRLTSGPCVVVQRVGSQGLHGRAPHDHDDSQSFVMWHGDVEVISERGTSAYTRSAAERYRDIISTSHNVTEFESAPRFGGRGGSVFMSARGAATCELSSISANESKTTITFGPRGSAVRIDRTISLEFAGSHCDLVVEDSAATSGPTALVSRFHFAPGIRIEVGPSGAGAAIWDERGRTRSATWQVSAGARAMVSVEEYECYEKYGRGRSASALVIRWHAEDGASLNFRFGVDCSSGVSTGVSGAC